MAIDNSCINNMANGYVLLNLYLYPHPVGCFFSSRKAGACWAMLGLYQEIWWGSGGWGMLASWRWWTVGMFGCEVSTVCSARERIEEGVAVGLGLDGGFGVLHRERTSLEAWEDEKSDDWT